MVQDARAALIIGAGPRLGAAIARVLGADGRPLGLVGRTADGVRRVVSMLRDEDMTAFGAAADISDPQHLTAAIDELREQTGDVDIAVHNVSAWRDAGAETLSAADLLADVAVGTASLATIANAVVPGMRRRGRGTLIATGSGAADHPTPGAPSLSVQKAGLRVLVEGFAQELATDGVHCAMVLIRGGLGDPGFDVADIAPRYAQLAHETDQPSETWHTIVDFPSTAPSGAH